MRIRPLKRRVHPGLDGDFTALYRESSPRLLAFFMRRVFDAEAAMDLAAETFAQALVSRRRFRGETDAELEAWLWAIARAQLSHYLRRGRAERRAIERLRIQTPALSEEDHARIEELAATKELRRLVAAALDQLSSGQREALRLRVVEELAYRDVAARLGVSETAARTRVARGLRALATAIEPRTETEVTA